jgi:hypothetical protein
MYELVANKKELMRHCLGFKLLVEIMITEPACTAIVIYVYPHAGVGYEC